MFYRSSNRRQSVRILNLTLMLFGLIGSVSLIEHITNQSTASANGEIRSHAGNNPTHMRNTPPVRTSATDALGRLPLTFEANHGQVDARVKFISRGAGYSLFLTPTETILALAQPTRSKPNVARGASPGLSAVLRMKLVGASETAQVVGLDQVPGRVNYFTGGETKAWRTNVPLYKRVKYESVYPGIDVVYYGSPQQQLEYDVHVAPGADPRRVRFSFEGARSVRVDKQGNLVLKVTGGEVRQLKPVIYQEVNGARRQVAGRYVLLDQHDVGFEVGTYDTSLALVIDPVLDYSSYLGGRGLDIARAVAVDGAGCVYVTGLTTSINFPVRNAYREAPPPDPFIPFQISTGTDVFVTKIDSAQAGDSSLIYSTYLGGTDSEEARAIAVDADGKVYITGFTYSSDLQGTPQDESFPVTTGAFQRALVFPREGHPRDAFITKLNAAGNGIVYSSYLGGGGDDEGEDIVVDATGKAFVTGLTVSFDSDPLQTNDVFPTTPGAFQPTNPMAANGGHESAFVAKFDPSQFGSASLVYSTYLGGSGGDRGYGIAVDTAGNAFVAGTTTSFDFPTMRGFQIQNNGGISGFVSLLNAGGTELVYSTYLGGNSPCPFSGCNTGEATDIAVDSSGHVYVTGRATPGLPTMPDVFQPTPVAGGRFVPFVAKLNTAHITETPTSVVYATYVGAGGHFDGANAIAVDSEGNAYITGATSGPFPTTPDAMSPNYNGGGDAFIAKLNPTGSSLLYGTYLGGSGSDTGHGIAVDANANIYVTGETESTNFPIAKALQPVYGGWVRDAFVTKIGLPTFTISGVVRNSSGEPVSHVIVTLSGSRNAIVSTNATGAYSFVVHAGGPYMVTPFASQYTFDPPVTTFTSVDTNVTANFTAIPAPSPTPTPTPQNVSDRDKSYFIVYGSAPFPQGRPSDHNFASQPATPFRFRSGGSITFDISVNRVVGDLNPGGMLADLQTLIHNGVVSKVAKLRILAFDVDSSAAVTAPAQPERDRVLFNGVDIGPQGSPAYLTGEEGAWSVSEFEVPINLVRFGKKNGNGLPTPGINRIEILVDDDGPTGDERWATAIDRAALSFDALAPVIMVHGTDSNSAFFTDWAFTLPFHQQRIPFDASINMDTNSIAVHGQLLATLITDRARSFGAKRVHIVAHSKGGLDTRDFLARTVPHNFGVLSLTTLCTPHHGSVAADYLIDANNANFLLSDDIVRTLMFKVKQPNIGTRNLRVSFLSEFNSRNLPNLPRTFTVDGETTPITYISFAADANLDGSVDFWSGRPNITLNPKPVDWITGSPGVSLLSEIIGTEAYSSLSVAGLPLMDMIYDTMGSVARTTLTRRVNVEIFPPRITTGYGVKEFPTGSFQLNDFLVTLESARLRQRFVSVPPTKANHATVANRNIAAEVIRRIRAVQPIK